MRFKVDGEPYELEPAPGQCCAPSCATSTASR